MDDINYDDMMNTVVGLVRQAGQIAKEVLGFVKDYTTKSCPTDLVTETDRELEKLIFNGLKEAFPNHSFIGEESSSESGCKIELTDNPTWIVDPIDGTMNFVHGFPYTAISVALVINKETKLAVVFDIGENHLYTAIKSRGAYRDGQQIKVSSIEDINTALILTEVTRKKTSRTSNLTFKNIENVHNNAHNVRVIGSAVIAACYVASGYGEGYFSYQLECWDVAAVSLIVQEAGGVVIDPSGEPFDMFSHKILCACTSSVAHALAKLIVDPIRNTLSE